MPVRDIERELETLSELRHSTSPEERIRALRKALRDRVNVIVAQAAKITADVQARDLIPDLCTAFDRLMLDPVRTDPQCWGKEAIVKALKDLGHVESEIYQRGVSHVQLEAVWNGEEDIAAGVRATCALALLDCTDLTREDKLWPLMRLLTQRSASLRKDAAIALASFDGREAALMLRIKARLGHESDPTVTGQVFESLLQIERDAAVPFIAEFLRDPDHETREEAALALGASRLTSAVETLKTLAGAKHSLLGHEVLFRALSISRNEEAIRFLTDIVQRGRIQEARDALAALALYRDSTDIRDSIAQAVATRTEPEIQRDFQQLLRPAES